MKNNIINLIKETPWINDSELADKTNCEIELVQNIVKTVDGIMSKEVRAPNGKMINMYCWIDPRVIPPARPITEPEKDKYIEIRAFDPAKVKAEPKKSEPAKEPKKPSDVPVSILNNRRFLVTLENGKEHIVPIEIDECVLKFNEIPKIISDPGTLLETELIMDIGKACFDRLNKRVKND